MFWATSNGDIAQHGLTAVKMSGASSNSLRSGKCLVFFACFPPDQVVLVAVLVAQGDCVLCYLAEDPVRGLAEMPGGQLPGIRLHGGSDADR